ncbi:MAG: DMT family transporter [Lachnospiraceae bacterium]|nr:DMT family transporter [Lachnospiraceae bacterium]
MEHKRAVILTCLVALLWSFAGLNVKLISYTPYGIAAGRSLIAAILITPVIMKSPLKKIDRYVVGGALCYAAFNYCFITSMKLTTTANAIMLQYTAPIYVVLLSWVFLREKITRVDLISIAFVFLGMILFFSDGAESGSLVGNVVAVFNGVTFAGISIFLRLQKNANPCMSMYLGNIISAVIGIPFLMMGGIPQRSSLFYLLIAGILVAVTYMLYAKASTGISALEAVLLPVLDPIMTPVWVFLFYGEGPGLLSILGSVIVLSSVTVRALYGIHMEEHHA